MSSFLKAVNVTAETQDNGMVLVSALIFGYRVKQLYSGYTEQEAIDDFTAVHGITP